MIISNTGSASGRGVFSATAGEAITLGDVLAYDLSASGDAIYYTVVKADTDSADKLVPAGVALNSAASGAQVSVQFWGHCSSVNVDGACVDGSPLFLGATAGRADVAKTVSAPDDGGGADTLTVPDLIKIGQATSADTSNIASAWISVPRIA